VPVIVRLCDWKFSLLKFVAELKDPVYASDPVRVRETEVPLEDVLMTLQPVISYVSSTVVMPVLAVVPVVPVMLTVPPRGQFAVRF
jgi:hypothetical protein